MRRKYKRLKFGGGQAYDHSVDQLSFGVVKLVKAYPAAEACIDRNPLYVLSKCYLESCSDKGCTVPIGPGLCDSADILVLKLRCIKRSVSTERPTPPLVEEETPLLKHVHA
jgi:hypothetical protein